MLIKIYTCMGSSYLRYTALLLLYALNIMSTVAETIEYRAAVE